MRRQPDSDSYITLVLATFKPAATHYESTATDEMAVPQGLSVVANVGVDGLTKRGQQVLVDGERRQLGVFGTSQRYNEAAGRLDVIPIVVFTRAERGQRFPC